VVVLGATNRPDTVDVALLRPGRFDRMILVPNPDGQTRKKILEINVQGKPIGQDINIQNIAEVLTEGFSGADTAAILNTAISIVLHEYLAKYPTPDEAAKHAAEAHVTMRHFEAAVKKIKMQRDTRPKETLALSHYG
jgi:transitional endoplasmic reticulum ATPase